MRIAIDARMFHKAGIRRYATELVQGLSDADRTNIYSVYLSSEDRTDKAVSPASNFMPVYLRAPLFGPGEQLDLISHLRKDGPDVFHTTFDFGVPLWPVRNAVVTVHDVFFGPDTYFRNYRTRLLYQYLTKYSVGRSSAVIVVSDFIRQKLLNYIPRAARRPDMIRVIPNGVSPRFSPVQAGGESEHIRKKYRITGKYIFCVGSFASRIKNLPGIIQAFIMLPDEVRRDHELVIAGEILDRVPEALQQMKGLQEEKKINCVGYVPDEDLVALYRNATVFVYPSLHEGFGIPVLEAMACGTPVISSNVTAIPEVAGEAALLVDPRNSHEISNAVSCVLTDPHKRSDLGKKGIERAKAFSWSATARKTLALYEELVRDQNVKRA